MDYKNLLKSNDKKFVMFFEDKVKDTLKRIKLNKKQKIVIAASGGKDSMTVLYLMKKFGYNVSALTVNAHIGCYSDENLSNLREFCSSNKIKLHEVSFRKEFGVSLCHIIPILEKKGIKKTSCSICGCLRRYLLNKHSKKLKADVLLTGHNLDDEANGILVSLFSGNLNHIARLGFVISNSGFVTKAKPLYFCFEDEVIRYSKLKNFNVKYTWCPCSSSGARRFYSELDIDDEKKFNLVSNFVNSIPKLRKYYSNYKEMSRCVNCSEPSSNQLCQACTILSLVKNADLKKINKMKSIAC